MKHRLAASIVGLASGVVFEYSPIIGLFSLIGLLTIIASLV